MSSTVGELDPPVEPSARIKYVCHAEVSSEPALLLEDGSTPRQSESARTCVTTTETIEEDCHICKKIICGLPHDMQREVRVILGSGTEVTRPMLNCNRHQKLISSFLRSHPDQSDEETYTRAQCIKTLEIHKLPKNTVALITVTMQPGCPFINLPFRGMYRIKKPGDPDNLVSGRVPDYHWIDPSLPKLWKSKCSRLHSGLCQGIPHEGLPRIRPTWLVDVKNHCVVPAPENCSYVALSYVWGDQPTVKATLGNMDQLRRVGALLKKPIPKTIQNAIAVTKLLDEKYLWVDTLCIVQDDGPEKHAEMSKMGAIFANSAVTIIAAQGKHANSGLRGFRGVSEARNLKQNVHCLAGEARVVLFPMGPSLSERGAHDTKWRTRGWTYQEHFFSRKRLIFDGDSVRWECAGAIWREHVEAYLHLEPQFKGAFLCEELFAPSVPDLNWLYWILRVYNKRSFTYPEDALYAFDGIALLASQPLVGGFVSGLPMAFFEIALLWQPEGKITRRVPRCPEKPCCLPSWSWAGWSGAIHFDRTSSTDFIRDTKRGLTAPYERRVESILSWKYHETAGVPGKPICASILATKEMWLKNQMEYSSLGWTKHLTTESLKKSYQSPDPRAPSKYFYKNKAYPGEEFWYPIPLARQVSPTPSIFAPYISCTTRRAWLFPDEEPPGKYGDGPILSLRVDGKMWAGIIQPHDGLDSSGETLQDLTNAIELVEIARGGCSETPDEYSSNIEEIMHPERPKKGQWYEYYWVMWVGWIDGIAYRKGLGRVQRQIWEEQRGEPFDLMLG